MGITGGFAEPVKEAITNTYLSVGAYARAYGITRQTVMKWLDHGLLISYRVDRVVRIKNVPPDAHQDGGAHERSEVAPR